MKPRIETHPSWDDQQPEVQDVSLPSKAGVPTEDLVRELQAAVRDCGLVSPWPGLFRVIALGGLCLGCVTIAWMEPIGWAFVGWSTIAAIFYGFWLVSTHDAVHHTLTGWVVFDEMIARVISWPILWAVGTYSELHRLHHSWNGRRLDDPERTQWTQTEYDRAGRLRRWYVRHQWVIDIFGCGAIGLILKTFRHGLIQGWFVQNTRSRLRWQLGGDVVGIVVVHTLLLAWVLAHDALGQYVLLWLIVERVVGVMMQCREHIEHYGLWRYPPQPPRSQVLTQLYATRNLHTTAIVNWLMGGLPYHGVHHAFPKIPCDRLPIAFERLGVILDAHEQPPLVRDPGYWLTSVRLAGAFCLIDDRHGDK